MDSGAGRGASKGQSAMRAARPRHLMSLFVFLALCAAVSALGAGITSSSVTTWYPTLSKPMFTPPDWVFAPVWTALFIMIAVAGWRIWRKRATHVIAAALTVYGIQLALNLGWSLSFFGMQRIGLAVVDILLLLTFIALNMTVFIRIDRIAALLLLPYFLWVTFAAFLTVRIWQLNT